jgi:peroxiredoxin
MLIADRSGIPMKIALLSLLMVLAAIPVAGARTAPDFTLPDSEGRQVTLSNYRGKWVVLEIMLPICPHCQAAAKVLEKMQLEFPTQLQVLGIATPGNGAAVLAAFKKEFGVTYPVLQGTPTLLIQYFGHPPAQVPAFALVSPSGEILKLRSNDQPEDKDFFANADQNLESMIRLALPPKKGVKSAPATAKKPTVKKPAAKQ